MTGQTVRKPRDTHDVIIVGATPAGSAAAIRARQLGLHTLLIEAEPPAPRGGRLDWLGPAATALCQTCGLDVPAVPAAEFAGLRLHSWELKRSRRVADAKLTGWIVERGVLAGALRKLAERHGSAVIPNAAPASLMLGEDCIALYLPDGRELRGHVLLIADGLDSPTAVLARLAGARHAESVAACAAVVLESTPGEVCLDVIVGARRAGQLVTILRAGGHLHVTLMTRESDPPVETEFADFLRVARAARLIPTDPAIKPSFSLTPAGVALDLEKHVGKRCILIGEAGGFVAAFSNEMVYPSMKSGWLAAEAVARALQARVLQDELLSFSSAWRAELAEYLRLPNTDLALLMPLVFNNAQMSARVAHAFLLGCGF